MNSDLASENLKYFAVSGTTEVHSLPAVRASVNCCGAFVTSVVAAFVDFAVDFAVGWISRSNYLGESADRVW